MRKNTARLFLFSSLLSISGMAENRKDSTQVGRNYVIDYCCPLKLKRA